MGVFDAKTLIRYSYRKIRCPYCGIVVEDLGLADPASRITKRLANYILDLCRFMTIKEIAKHLSLDWKTVKNIHKRYLQGRFSHEDVGCPRLLAIDEISLKKRHQYLTVVINWETGRVL